MQVVLEDAQKDGQATRQVERWAYALHAGTWPEVARRFVLTKLHAPDVPMVTDEVVAAAHSLGSSAVQDLPPLQALRLLAALCDAALDTELLRGELQQRIDKMDKVCTLAALVCLCDGGCVIMHVRQRSNLHPHVQVAKEARDVQAEERRKLREAQEHEKGIKKRKREEQLATAATPTTADVVAAQEPRPELPAELQEYQGAPDDRCAFVHCFCMHGARRSACYRSMPMHKDTNAAADACSKAQLAFRQQQLKAKKKLDKERAAWGKEQARRAQAAAALEKEEQDAAKKAKKALEEVKQVVDKQGARCEREAKRNAIRAAPLGHDRAWLPMWHGLAGEGGPVLAVTEAGGLVVLSEASEVESVAAALDTRGIRERALAKALQAAAEAMQASPSKGKRAQVCLCL